MEVDVEMKMEMDVQVEEKQFIRVVFVECTRVRCDCFSSPFLVRWHFYCHRTGGGSIMLIIR